MKIKICIILALTVHLPLSSQIIIKFNPARTFQTIHGFGASDAWSNDFLIAMDDSSRNQAADWLFSKEMNSDGSFRGIGLSIWRYNLGAGSSEQGDSSQISDPFRRTECFLDADGKYSWTKQPGTQWMLKAAKERGIENLVMFSNSPPVSLTLNGKAFSDKCGESNLPIVNNKAFAEYIVQSIRYFKDNNIHFSFVSPVNEPEWGWCRRDGQEGCPYKNVQTAELARMINKGLIRNGLLTKIQVPESGLLVFANSGLRTKAGRQNEIENFFKKRKSTFIGDEPQVARQICAHGYFTEWPLWLMRSVRKKTARKAAKYNLEYWMSEYCILRKTRKIDGAGRDPGMKTALYVSRVIHHDLVYGNASAWCWWLGISSADFKDGLAYVNRNGTGLTDSKTMWAMGNFSRFIHPGAVRIEVSGRSEKQLFVSAYLNRDAGNIVIVIINMKNCKQVVELKNLPGGVLKGWETSRDSSLTRLPDARAEQPLTVSGESITTYVLN